MKIDLNGKNALVCGASHGIGKAIALELADSGANVTLLARSKDALDSVFAHLNNNGKQKHHIISADIRDFDKISEQLNNITSVHSSYHILINNTGGPPAGALHKADEKELNDAFEMHVISAQRLLSLLLPGMEQMHYGRIINIISVGLKQPIANLGVSNTIRGAMGSWAKTLASELAQYGITVNNILPGYTNTGRLKNLFENISKNEKKSKEQVISEIVSEIPAGRLGEPSEIAYIVAFLTSDLAGYINGINLPVDGGYLRTL